MSVRYAPALRHRDFRLLWLGQLISFSGSQMQAAAVLWQVYTLTGDPLALGLVGLVRIVPIVLFSLISGIVADAVDRRKLMVVTQVGMALSTIGLFVLSLQPVIPVWLVYAFAFLSSAFSAFDMPARQSLIPSLVPREDLANAFSLNSTMAQLASVVGPTAAGLLIGWQGVSSAYLIDAASFVAVIAALLAMRPPAPAARSRSEISWQAAWEGAQFVFRHPIIRSTMLLDFFATFFASATALLPIFAQDILRVGAQGYGLLLAAPAAGALLTGLVLSARTRFRNQGPALLWSVAGFGAATLVFAFSRSFWLTIAALAATGAADMVSMVIRNTVRQLSTPDHLRGRMVSLNMIFFMGGPQLGELEAGFLARWLSAPVSVFSGGIGCLLATGWVAAATPELRGLRDVDSPASSAAG